MNVIKFSILINLFLVLFFLNIHIASSMDITLQSIASVNEEIITNYDINIRSNLINSIITNAQSSQKTLKNRYNKENINKNITDDLIKEILKISEAKKYGIDATESEIKQGMVITSSRFGLSEKQFNNIMLQSGCQKDIWINNKINICYQMILSDIVWSKFVGMFFSSQISNTDIEIEDEVNKYTDYFNFLVNDLNLSQIILKNKKDADTTYSRIKDSGCKGFDIEMKQNTNGSGNLGFIKLHDTSKIVREHIKNLPIDVVSKPLKNTDNNYYLYIICDKKIDKDLEKKLIPIKEMKLRISNAIINNKLEVLAKKYLEKLFNSSFIEYM